MINILSKKFLEVFSEPRIQIGGKWKVAIVDDNNNIFFPFGDKYQDNLILDQGLDVLVENKYYSKYLNYNWNTIPSFLKHSAVLGIGQIAPNTYDTSLTNETLETFEINDDSCSIQDVPSQGLRIFKKVYDFKKPEDINGSLQGYMVYEMGVKTEWNDTLFTKFLLNESLNIRRGQWVRLFYDFYVYSDSIINPIPISLSSGSFNGTGTLKLVGRFDDIFGSFDSNGNPVIVYGDSPRSSFMPFCEEFCVETDNCANKCFGTAYMISPFMQNFNTVNTRLISEWIGKRLSVANSTILPSNYNSGSFYRDITYIFDENNPIKTESCGAFLFTNVKTNRENTIDGWLWKFNNSQSKKFDKKLVINLRQSISRI